MRGLSKAQRGLLEALTRTEGWGLYHALLDEMLDTATRRVLSGAAEDFPYNKGFREGLLASRAFLSQLETH